MGLYLAGFMSRIAEYSYMAINFLLYFHTLYISGVTGTGRRIRP